MLPKKNRLKKKKDFERVFKKGRGVKGDFLFVKAIPNDLKETRFGFIVSLKISKKATLRNKVKRSLREIVRSRLPEIKRGFDVVLIARPGLQNNDFSEIEVVVDKIFKKARILE